MPIDAVLSVLVQGIRGKRFGYTTEWVNRLHRGVARNLPCKAEHFCLTDTPHGVDTTLITLIDIGDWWRSTGLTAGWWAKVALHSPHLPFKAGDRLLYSDIDNMITGDLTPLVEDANTHAFAACPMTSQNFRRHDPNMERRISSAFMIWDHGYTENVFRWWTPDTASRYYGDQDWLGSVVTTPHVLPRERFLRGTRLIRRGFQALKPDVRVMFCTKMKCNKMAEAVPQTREFWR